MALDSYNRGYGAALSDSGPGDTDGLGEEAGTQIGNASILKSSRVLVDPSNPSSRLDQPIGFYAIAYEMLDGSGRGTGEKIISYRGTDGAMDVATGWPTGLGYYNAGQDVMAAAFYKSVIGNESPYMANVSFTGHSLGGGLAGARRDDQKTVY